MHPKNGFTLIEVVIAIVLFAIGGLALALNSAMIARQLSANNARQRSTLAARSQYEKTMAVRCTAPPCT
jgi:prepilin-type N-terminal cleavage/methylation domain-containing protein